MHHLTQPDDSPDHEGEKAKFNRSAFVIIDVGFVSLISLRWKSFINIYKAKLRGATSSWRHNGHWRLSDIKAVQSFGLFFGARRWIIFL